MVTINCLVTQFLQIYIFVWCSRRKKCIQFWNNLRLSKLRYFFRLTKYSYRYIICLMYFVSPRAHWLLIDKELLKIPSKNSRQCTVYTIQCSITAPPTVKSNWSKILLRITINHKHYVVLQHCTALSVWTIKLFVAKTFHVFPGKKTIYKLSLNQYKTTVWQVCVS